MQITRRGFIKHGALTLAAMAAAKDQLFAYGKTRGVKFKVGVPDWNLRQEAKPESVAFARRLGFDGVQISLGVGRDRLPLSEPAVQQAFIAESKRAGLPLASVCLNIACSALVNWMTSIEAPADVRAEWRRDHGLGVVVALALLGAAPARRRTPVLGSRHGIPSLRT